MGYLKVKVMRRLPSLGKAQFTPQYIKVSVYREYVKKESIYTTYSRKAVAFPFFDIRILPLKRLDKIHCVLYSLRKNKCSEIDMIDNLLCPRCGSNKLNKYGFIWSGRNKRQRYTCRSCHRATMKPTLNEGTEVTLSEGVTSAPRNEMYGNSQC